MTAQTAIDLRVLGEPPGMPAVSVAAGRYFAEAAAVCLDKFHSPAVTLQVRGVRDDTFLLGWDTSDAQTQRTHADPQDATEFGAHAVAFSLAKELTNYVVVERSRKGTGFDYWLGNGSEPDLFKARLEISGILTGDDAQIAERVRIKTKQTERSKSTMLPAYACVVEFSRPEARFVQA